MQELLKHYSPSDIIIFIVVLAVAIKEVVTFLDWATTRLKQQFVKSNRNDEQDKNLQVLSQEIEALKIEIKNNRERISKLHEDSLSKIEKSTEIMLQLQHKYEEQSKNSIKSWIVDKYHFFTKQGFIDDYSLDCLERRFSDYKDNGGNSYIESLMRKIRNLPITSSVDVDKEEK